MQTTKLHLLLADDDADDCLFFKEALEEIPVTASLATVNDGIQLMQHLQARRHLFPDILYLDLNMPRKNGYECLSEIRNNEKLRRMPIVIYSTPFDKASAESLYEQGASYYIRKPAEFPNLKKVIQRSIELISTSRTKRPSREDFIINSD